MRVLILSNGELKEREIENTLEELQKLVGGYIEVPYLGKIFRENGIDVIVNEEGKFVEGLRPEIVILDEKTRQTIDVVYGNCVFATHDEEGNTVQLSQEQAEIVMKELEMDVMLTFPDKDEAVKVKALFIQ